MKKIILTVALLIATPVLARTIVNHSDILGVGSSDHHTLYSHPNHSGDVTSSGDGAQTIADDAVTYPKMQNVAADNVLLGNNSGAGGPVDELTGTEATALLDPFTATLKGLAPLSGGGTTNFLRADGTWAAPPGGASPLTTKGDIYTYDTGDQRLGVGTDGQVLTADSAEATGLKWADPTGGGGGSSAPIGSIMAYGSSTPPTGWLIADGTAVSRATYSDLFAVISTNFGEGDGVTTFNLPDLRGKFIRGHDNGAGNDPNAETRVVCNTGGATGDNVGSCQGDEFKAHTHNAVMQNGGNIGSTARLLAAAGDGAPLIRPDVILSAPNTGSETRPTNVYASYIIRATNSGGGGSSHTIQTSNIPSHSFGAGYGTGGTVDISVVVAAGESVMVEVLPKTGSGAAECEINSTIAASTFYWQFTRDAAVIGSGQNEAGSAPSLANSPTVARFLDVNPGAGTYAYNIKWARNTSGPQISANCMLVATVIR